VEDQDGESSGVPFTHFFIRHFDPGMLISQPQPRQPLRLLMTQDSLELFNKIMISQSLLKLLMLKSIARLPSRPHHR
jgi:hypothetical protein